ncbi:WC11 protein, partial [Polypterus senegalus]|nr:WC11 protein [Polypterus senegalus]
MYGDTWGTVCDDDWDLKDVKVVCRQLRCGEAVSAELEFGGGSGVIWLNKVKCRGTEAHLWDCQHEPLGKNDCVHKEDAGVKCTGMAMDELLPNNNAVYEEIEYKLARQGTYGAPRKGSFLSDELPYDYEDIEDDDQDHTLENISHDELLYSYDDVEEPLENSTVVSFLSDELPYDYEDIEDDDQDHTQGNILHDELLYSYDDAGEPLENSTIDNQDLKLVNGKGPCEGRVEVLRNGQWGTVCGYSSDWDMKNAAVVCRQLGCGEALSAPRYAHFARGTGPVLMSAVNCNGQESALKDCQSKTYSCDHYYDVSTVCSGSGARLVGGSSSCSGRLEMLDGYSWKSICDTNFNQMAAEVVCRELDCGAPKKYQGGMFGQGTAYRLVNGSDSECSGRVELYYDRRWGTVCDRYWDLQDASVLCNQIGCGYAIEAPGQAKFGEGKGEIWRDNLHCEGNEADLTKCPALDYGREECTHKNDAGVICSNHIALRLLNGTSVCDGRVEIFYNGSWGTVCDDSWGFPDANVVCRQLQCEAAVNAITPVSYGPGTGHIWLDNVRCRGNESFLWDCRHQKWGKHDCRHKEDVGVNCTEFKMLRLTNGCSGQLQVFYKNLWGSICANKLDKATATMICQELGCGSLKSTIIEGISKLNSDPKWLDEVNCRGHETSIWQCPSSPWGKNKCTRNEVAEFSCSGKKKKSKVAFVMYILLI